MILIITQNNNKNKNNYNNNDDDDESRGLQKFNPENFKGASVLYHVPDRLACVAGNSGGG